MLFGLIISSEYFFLLKGIERFAQGCGRIFVYINTKHKLQVHILLYTDVINICDESLKILGRPRWKIAS